MVSYISSFSTILKNPFVKNNVTSTPNSSDPREKITNVAKERIPSIDPPKMILVIRHYILQHYKEMQVL